MPHRSVLGPRYCARGAAQKSSIIHVHWKSGICGNILSNPCSSCSLVAACARTSLPCPVGTPKATKPRMPRSTGERSPRQISAPSSTTRSLQSKKQSFTNLPDPPVQKVHEASGANRMCVLCSYCMGRHPHSVRQTMQAGPIAGWGWRAAIPWLRVGPPSPPCSMRWRPAKARVPSRRARM